MATPLDNIENGHKFQQIVAEYFRCLKEEQHEFHIADLDVEDNGVGGDDGCDILVDFHFEDVIRKHSHRWVIECKSQKRAVGPGDIDIGRISGILKGRGAMGYLLVCKTDATASLKRNFKEISSKQVEEYVIWNGSQLWRKFSKRESFIKAFFPQYYKKEFLDSGKKEEFERFYNKFKKEIK